MVNRLSSINTNNRYLNAIHNCMDGYQKDYYKECTIVNILLSYGRNHSILIIFGKTDDEINDFIWDDKFAYRTILRYPYVVKVQYPLGASKEYIITKLQRAIDSAIGAKERTEAQQQQR